MALTPGTRFGSHQIAESIGSGGIGQVWRARDTELERDIAIEVLPAAFAADADRVARFEQEAKTLAGLNHGTIAHIYGIERARLAESVDGAAATGASAESADGRSTAVTTVLVMELVDEPTLADRIAHAQSRPTKLSTSRCR